MTWGIEASLGLLVLLLALSCFFSGSETALFSLGKLQRRRLEREGKGAAKVVCELLARPKHLLITILVGNMTVNTLASAAATALCLALLGDRGLGVAVPGMTVLLLLFGEVTPKVFAVRHAEWLSTVVARPLRVVERVLAAPVFVLERVTDRVVDWLAPPRTATEPLVTVDELSMLVKIGEEAGELKRREKELIDYIIEFQETVVREVMTPRLAIEGICRSWPPERIRETIRRGRWARMPVYTRDLDDVDGILTTKRYLLSGADALDAFVERPFCIPESKKVHGLLQDFRERGLSMAVVLDEHGGLTGLVTLEDLVEELFGEVYDEDEAAEVRVVELPGGGFRMLGHARVDEVAKRLGVSLSSDEDAYDTLAGYCMARLGRIPKRGEEFLEQGWRLRVTKVASRRILEVVAEPAPPQAPPPPPGEAPRG